MAVDALFAARLNKLFATVYPPDRGPHNNSEVIEALARRGIEISAPYLSQLRTGRRNHPSIQLIVALSDFFGVKHGYLADTDPVYCAQIDTELGWLAIAHDARARDLVTSVLRLSPEMQDSLLAEVS